MQTLHGTVPHFIRVQATERPDPLRDGMACIYVPLDETVQGVSARLAKVARALAEVGKILGTSKGGGVVTEVDGNICNISIPHNANSKPRTEAPLADSLSQLVAPKGWRPA